MYSRAILIWLLYAIALSAAFAQEKIQDFKPADGVEFIANAGTLSAPLETPLAGIAGVFDDSDKWAISVRPVTSRTHGDSELAQIKAAKKAEKYASYSTKSIEDFGPDVMVQPQIGVNFEANWSLFGSPPDNAIAISNGGFIVTANNDGIEYYAANGQFLKFDFWSDFFNDNSLNSIIYDPRVIYDPVADRFVMVVLHGSTSQTSVVLLCFSQTNNPLNGWWVYKLNGNSLNADNWFDYPALGFSNNEVYITGNLFNNNGQFSQAVIYQIPKAPGYAGQNIMWKIWSNLNDSPFPAFSLVPTPRGHQGSFGPGMYFVSNRAGGESRIRLWDITDDLGGNPQITVANINVNAYAPAADAQQLGSNEELDNGDCRIQNAFFHNGIIHFVHNTDVGQGWSGISYNRLTVSSQSVQTSTFGLQGSFDYAYPVVAPFSTTPTDRSVMIAFLRTSQSIYPEARVVNCDNNMQWSGSTLIKQGETFVNMLSSTERWGDYTGLARRHNSPTPRVWAAASYGADIPQQGAFNHYKTWVAEIFATSSATEAPEDVLPIFQVAPNPVYDLAQVRFEALNREEVSIELYDADGRLARLLYRDTPKAGLNELRFNKGALRPGTYFLIIKTANNTIKHEKIIILD